MNWSERSVCENSYTKSLESACGTGEGLDMGSLVQGWIWRVTHYLWELWMLWTSWEILHFGFPWRLIGKKKPYHEHGGEWRQSWWFCNYSAHPKKQAPQEMTENIIVGFKIKINSQNSRRKFYPKIILTWCFIVYLKRGIFVRMKFFVNHVAFFIYYVFGSAVGGGC